MRMIMMKRALTLALAATFAVGLSAQTSSQKPTPAPAAAAKTKTMTMAQGSWVFMTADGQDVSGSGQEIVITITDDKYVQLVNGAIAERGTFKLDEAKKPMWIDIKITEGD